MMHCPSCRQTMVAETFDHRMQGDVTLDICYPCNAIWFDHMESTQLSPGAVIELFKKIHAHKAEGHRAFGQRMGCARCHKALQEVNDFQRAGRFSYHRCPEGHGRLTSFYHFLREKQFVRDVTEQELNKLKASVVQMRCSGCGGPVNLQKDTACPYCRAPISILDSAAVEKTLKALNLEESQRGKLRAVSLDEAMRGEQQSHAGGKKSSVERGNGNSASTASGSFDSVDLVAGCISIVAAFFE
jgi:Zn-finger nucleic acid-binding protein